MRGVVELRCVEYQAGGVPPLPQWHPPVLGCGRAWSDEPDGLAIPRDYMYIISSRRLMSCIRLGCHRIGRALATRASWQTADLWGGILETFGQ